MMDDLDPDLVELVPCAPSLPTAPRTALAEVTFRADAWLPGDLQRLRALFEADEPVIEIAAQLGRTVNAVRTRIEDLGLRRNSQRSWSAEDDCELSSRYGREPTSAIAASLGRSCGAVYARAGALGLTEGNAPAYTPWEDAQLVAGYERGITIATISVMIGRPGSGIISRAQHLGLRHKNKAANWTDLEVLRALELAEAGMFYTAIGRTLGAEGFPTRSKVAVERVLHSLGYARGWGRAWTPEEDVLLRRVYERGESLTPLRFRLGRTAGSLRWRAEYLGLRGTHANSGGFRGGPIWSPQDETLLTARYGHEPTRAVAAALGRPLRAIYTKAHALGLVHGWMKPFTAEDAAAIRIAYHRGLSLTDLADALGRDIAVVSKHAKRHLDLHFSARTVKAPRGPRALRRTWTLAAILELGIPEDEGRA